MPESLSTTDRRAGKRRLSPKVALFILVLPGIVHFVVFRYVPLFGNIIAFMDYNLFSGIFKSKFVGFKHFIRAFGYAEFFQILRNTLLISFYRLVLDFPAPIILALFLNEIPGVRFKRIIQTVLYLPHFLSWVIVGGIFIRLLSVDGIVNDVLAAIGLPRIGFITEPAFFRWVLVLIGTWKEVGWGMIIYLAAISGINPTLYEAAVMDGAGRIRQMWSITLPGILPAVVTLMLLRIGRILESNVEQVLILINPLVREVGEVVNTYIYRVGLLGAQFSYTAAIGIFKALVGLVLIVVANQVSKRLTGSGIY